MNETQCKRLLEYLDKHGSITQLEAIEKLGIMRLGARIFDLKRTGYKIKTEMIEVKNRFGELCRCAWYSIVR